MERYFHRHFKRILVMITGIILVLTVIIMHSDASNNYETNLERMMEKAEYFDENGKAERAITQIRMYLDNRKEDVQAWERLGEIYEKLGNQEMANEAYASGTLINNEKLNGGVFTVSSKSFI